MAGNEPPAPDVWDDAFDDEEDTRPRMADPDWDIRREGRGWRGDEAWQRYELTPEKLEMVDGRLLWSEQDRVHLLGLLLENVGADRAVRLGDPQVWRDAVAARGRPGQAGA